MKHKKKNAANVADKKEFIVLFAILILGIFLRFFRLEETFYFSGEIGHNLLTIKNAYVHTMIPLIGPPTSHPWLFFGPLFYWIYGPVLILSKFNPISHAYFGAVIAVLVLPFNYFVIRKLFTIRIALLSTFLIAISPLFLEFAHFARFFTIVPLLVYPFIYFLYRIIHGEKRFLFWFGFVYGSMFSFHFTPLMLFPFVLSMFFLKKIQLTAKEVLFAVCGVIIPLLPFLLYDAGHGMQMTLKILLWIPYRVAGFFGLVPKNTVSAQVLHENTTSFFSFIEKSFFPPYFPVLLLVIVLAGSLYLLWANERVFQKHMKFSDSTLLLLLWFGWGFLSVFVHGSPPIHYFLPLLPLPILFFSLFLDFLWNKRLGRYLVYAFLALIFFVTQGYYFSDKWFYRSETKGDWSLQDVPFELQKYVAKVIIDDAHGKKFQLKRIGVNDQFEDDYAQNYVYLLWLLGNEPVQKAATTYVIVEEPERIGRDYAAATEFLRAGNIVIIKIPTALLPKDERIGVMYD